MRILHFLIAFISVVAFAQSKPLSIAIKSVVTDNSETSERRYTIDYEITNNTNKDLTFYFIPGGFGGSLSNKLYYKIYQNDEFLDNGNVLNQSNGPLPKEFEEKTNPETNTKEEINAYLKKFFAEEYNIDMDSIKQNPSDSKEINITTPHLEIRARQNQLFSMAPNETKKFTENVFWNKKRYFFKEPHEYYIEEKAKHFIEFTMVLYKEQLKSRLPESEFNAMMNNPNFIQGVFISNKMAIDFGL